MTCKFGQAVWSAESCKICISSKYVGPRNNNNQVVRNVDCRPTMVRYYIYLLFSPKHFAFGLVISTPLW